MSAPGPAGDAQQAEAAGADDTRSMGVPPPRLEKPEGEQLTARPRGLGQFLLRNRRHWIAGLVLAALVITGLVLVGPHLQACYHFRAAKSSIEAFHNPQAVRHLKVCLRVWPTDPDVLLLAARAARRARSYDEAEGFLQGYQKARGLDDALSFEQLLLAAERDVGLVAPICRRHVEQDHPDAPLILEALTRGYLRQFRLSEARFCLDRWLEKQPANPQALCLQGEFYLDYERAPDRAAESYRRAVEMDPEHEEAHMGLAIVLLESKSFAEALVHVEYVQRYQPDNLRVQVGLAECRNGLGEREEAERLVEKVLVQQPQYRPALSLRGRLAVENGQYADAETWLRQALALSPSDHEARYSLILCLFNTGRAEEATRQEQELKQLEDDIKRFSEIVAVEMPKRPNDPELHFTLGQLLVRSGHREEGLRWLNSALRLDPQYAPARQAVVEYYEKTKIQQQAKP